jgi:Asp-tRNA(Asn)/Glu-tRNA(Gln) amidotransferase A subunit family amidase
VPARDAFVVERLKAAGAIVMGKTVTTELAFLHPGKTRNPHNPAHARRLLLGFRRGGGGRHGAARRRHADRRVGDPPAAFCGVTGFKPTFGAIPRRGVLMQSPTLDTVGVFAADPKSAGLLAEALFGQDEADPATRAAPHPRLFDTASAKPPSRPPSPSSARPAGTMPTRRRRTPSPELVDALGDQVFEVELPRAFEAAAAERQRINFAEMARHYHRYGRDGADLLSPRRSPRFAKATRPGPRLPRRARLEAGAERGAREILERCDAILCPAAPGPAPEGLGSTGNAIFNGLWTFCGTPAVTVPILTAGNGLPMGVQLIGRLHDDARLLRTAQWLHDWADG